MNTLLRVWACIAGLYATGLFAADLTVTLTPAHAKWRLNWGPWQDSGTTVSNLTTGPHRIFFQPLSGYNPPANLLLNLQANESRSIAVEHIPLGSPVYSAVLISNPGGEVPSAAYRINNNGAVVGYYLAPQGGYNAFKFSEGTLLGLGTFGGARSYAFGLNSAGDVVGGSEITDGKLHAFLFDAGTKTDLGTLGGNLSSAQDVNDSGVVVGWANFDSTSNMHAFRRENGIMQDLGTLGGASSRAMALNNQGLVVGSSQVASGSFRAFAHQGGSMQNLGTLGGDSSHAYSVNEAGWIVGSAQNSEGLNRAFLLREGVMENLGTIGSEPHSEAIDINLHGTVVGQAFTDLSVPGRAFVHANGVMRDLNELVNIPGVLLHATGGINDRGQIVAIGTDYVRDYVYVLTPLNAIGSLQVNLVPGSGQWRVDGGEWQSSSATVTGLASGNHTVVYQTLSGFTSPSTEVVSLSAGQTTVLNRVYTPTVAQLTVTLDHPNGRWRINDIGLGVWQISGATISDLAPGDYTIEYESVAEHFKPPTETVTLVAGQALTLTRQYTQWPGDIRVFLNPEQGEWRVDGGPWQASGVTVAGLVAGSHTVEYKALTGYIAPPSETITLSPGESFVNGRVYTPAKAQITVSLTPANAQWNLDGTAWLASGATLSGLDAGDYELNYQQLAGYTPPPSETVTLVAGQSLIINRSYAPATPSVSFTATDLGTLGGTRTFASAINLAGMVTGYSYIAGDAAKHAFLYDNGAMMDLGTLGGTYSRGFSINDSGVVVGVADTATSWERGFVSRDGVMETIPTLSGIFNNGYAINNLGTIVGYSSTADDWGHAYKYSNGSLSDLGTPGFSSMGLGINESGHVVGMAVFESGTSHQRAFLHAGTSMINLGTLGGTHSQANVINDAGVIVGSSTLVGDVAERAFRYQNGLMTDLGTLGGNSSSAYGINEAGTIVGWASDSLSTTRAFILRNGLMEDLNTLVDLPGVRLTEALGPNELGQIVANADNNRAYLLTPINAQGGVQVNLTPASGQWRMDGGVWQTSGSPVMGVGNGQHSIEYSFVPGYSAPSAETITVSSGRLVRLNRTYGPGLTSQLSVSLSPTSAQWRVDGGDWRTSGSAAMLTAGNHTVEYFGVNGYTAPGSETVTLESGQVLNLTRDYAVITGLPAQVTIALNPSAGKWRIDGSSWRNSGYTATNVTSGAHLVEYYAVSGYTTPLSETITLLAGANSLTRTYAQLAQLAVSLTPATGKWRIDSGSWRTSGSAAINLSPGEHLVEYYTVAGYAKPPAETVTLLPGANTLARNYTQLAQLTVTLAPSTAKWRVDGGSWRTSGYTEASLTPGDHLVEYAALTGYAPPPSETLSLPAGANSITRSYAQLAQLTVTLTPTTAKWRIDGGIWRSSGSAATSLTPGEHLVEFNSVSGYATPPSETISLLPGANTLTRSYAQLAQLTITLTPTTAKWRIDGGSWRSSGYTTNNLTLGDHLVEYYAVSGYTAPPGETVTLNAGANTLARSYAQLAQLTVTLTPATAKWRIDGGIWRSSGSTATNLALGEHLVEYYTVSGYTAPPGETVTLVAGANTLARSYAQLAQLTVTLTPATGKWRIDGGTWRSSGTSATNLTVGEHLVEYSTLTGYVTPPSETVTLGAGPSLLQRNYQ